MRKFPHKNRLRKEVFLHSLRSPFFFAYCIANFAFSRRLFLGFALGLHLLIEVCTYNTDLKNRLTKFAAEYPNECKLLDDDEMGCLTFEVRKGRFGFKLTAPYSEERRKAAGELAKKENLRRNGK